MNLSRPIVLLMFTVVSSATLLAQRAPDGTPRDSTAVPRASLTVRASVDSAVVMLDGRQAGVTPLTIDTLSPGSHVLRVIDPDVSNWLTEIITDTVRLQPGERLVRTYELTPKVSLGTTPAGARVFLNDSLVGMTPLVFLRDSTFGHSLLTLRKDGFKPLIIQLQDSGRGSLHFSLAPEWPGNAPENNMFAQALVPERSRTVTYISGATAVLAGIATAYLKIKADDRQDQYVLTGDPSLQAERVRLDRGAAITYVVTQISFGIFAYFLLSD